MHPIFSFSCFLTHPQHCARWVGVEHVDRMLPDMHRLQEVGEVIMLDAPHPPGITIITLMWVLVPLPVSVTLHPLSTTSTVTKVSIGVLRDPDVSL